MTSRYVNKKMQSIIGEMINVTDTAEYCRNGIRNSLKTRIWEITLWFRHSHQAVIIPCSQISPSISSEPRDSTDTSGNCIGRFEKGPL